LGAGTRVAEVLIKRQAASAPPPPAQHAPADMRRGILHMRFTKALLSTLVMLTPVVASAQSAPANDTNTIAPDTGTPDKTAAPTPSGQLPPATSDHDAAPPVPTPTSPGINADV